MANTAPQVMLLKLCSPLDRVVSGYYDALQTRIEAKFRVLIQHNDTAIGKYLSPATPPAAILVVEGWPANRANSDLQSQLADYVKAGGTLIVAMFFPDWDEDSEHNALYQKIGLDWEVGSRHTSRVTLNPDLEPVFGPPLYATLESPYEVWAAHLKHVSSSAKVYTPTRSSIVENPGFPPKEIDLEQCSVAFARCDEGFVGFIGDPLHRKGSEKLLMAMLETGINPYQKPSTAETPSRSSDLEMPDLLDGCLVCGKLRPVKKCSRCRTAQYCSPACQASDWDVHKADCVTHDVTSHNAGSISLG